MDTRELFDVPNEVVFLNAANIGPRLRSVLAAGHTAVERWARPWTLTAPDWVADREKLRDLAAELLGGDADGVAVVPSMSYGMALAARNLPVRPGQTILLLDGEFPSNYYIWKRVAEENNASLRILPRPKDAAWGEAIAEAIDPATAIVAVPACHWTDGALTDIERVAARAREQGAAVVIDASQSLGVLPLEIQRIDPDFVVSVGYKWLLGPFGVTYLYAASRHRQGTPLEEAWPAREESHDLSRLTEYRDEYRAGARRFDAGEMQNFLLLPMALAALAQINEWTPGIVAERLRSVTNGLAASAEKLGLETTPSAVRSPHFFGIRVGIERATAIAASLMAEGVFVGVRGDSIRVAPHMHTSDQDCDMFARVLRAALAGVPAPQRGSRTP